MKLLDTTFFKIFRTITFGVELPVEKLNMPEVCKIYSWVNRILILCTSIYIANILKYSNVIFIIPTKGARMALLGIIFVILLFSTYWYFSNVKAVSIITKYYTDRSGSKRSDIAFGIIFILLPFVLLIAYDPLKPLLS